MKRHNYQDIGRQYLAYLLEDREYDEAARLCVKILGKNKVLWEEEVYKFAQIQQLKAIAPYLPRDDPKLTPGVYEMVLNEFLQTDHVVRCRSKQFLGVGFLKSCRGCRSTGMDRDLLCGYFRALKILCASGHQICTTYKL